MQFELDLKKPEDLEQKFWPAVGNSKVFAFHGEMGAGKTTTITRLCRHLGVESAMGSPTFSIINEYEGRDEKGSRKPVYHIDLYRLESDEEVVQTGVEDCINSGDYCFVEWPDKAPWLFNDEAVHVFIRVKDNGVREMEIRNQPDESR